jgi:hypothetical protein
MAVPLPRIANQIDRRRGLATELVVACQGVRPAQIRKGATQVVVG